MNFSTIQTEMQSGLYISGTLPVRSHDIHPSDSFPSILQWADRSPAILEPVLSALASRVAPGVPELHLPVPHPSP